MLFSDVVVATNSKGPPAFNTPLEISSATARSTGSGSPVNADSSKVASIRKRPSVGVISPERISNRSPIALSSTLIISIAPPATTRFTVRGIRESNAFN